jgi:uncharacterized protein (DUF169 family)
MSAPPVGIAFASAPPEGVPRSPEPAPSTCTFWRRGQTGVFYATADDHANCAIGLMTMGFPLSPEQEAQAQSLVGTMASLHYFDPAEVQHLPGIRKPHQVIVYGPLAQLPIDPDQVVLLLDPYQVMLASEALGRVAWAETSQLGAFGRPACGALPKSEQLGSATLSLGCIGARAYTDLPANEMLLVVPAAQLEAAADALGSVLEANQKLAAFHAGQRQALTGAH